MPSLIRLITLLVLLLAMLLPAGGAAAGATLAVKGKES